MAGLEAVSAFILGWQSGAVVLMVQLVDSGDLFIGSHYFCYVRARNANVKASTTTPLIILGSTVVLFLHAFFLLLIVN